jgi:regulator of sigma E protease
MTHVPSTLLAFLVVLGIIIFVHEFGHFITAKFFGMRVFIFSFGFGKRLFGVTRGDTDYRVSLVPLGGYVKLEGEADDYLSENTALEGDRKDFLARPRWQRFLVYLAGPAMNVVLTILVLWVLHMVGFGEPSSLYDRPVIGAVDAGSVAAQAGLLAGDEILAVDGKVMASWFDVLYSTKLSPGRTLTVRYRRESAEHEVPLRPVATGPEKTGEIGVHPLVFVLSVDPGSPAEAAGLRAEDAILTVDGQAVPTIDDVAPKITASAGRPVVLRLLRAGQPLEVTATPRVDAGTPRIGIRLGERVVVRQYGPIDALGASLRRTWAMTTQIVDVLRRLVTARISVRTMAGPLGIARESGNAARAGGLAFFGFIAFISLNVGLLNLFPLTPLDGGHMLLLAVEGAFRRDLSVTLKGWIMNAGAAAILVLLVVVVYSDLAKTSWLKPFLP